MAVTVQGTATVAESSSSTTLSLAVPTGTTVGEMLIMAVAMSDGTAAVPDQTGWTSLGKVASGQQAPSLGLFWRTVDGTEGSTISISGLTLGRCTAFCVRTNGVSTTTPLDVAVTTVAALTGTSVVFPSVTTVTAGARSIAIAGINATNAEVLEPASDTELAKHTQGTGRAMTMSAEAFPSAGAIGTRTWTWSTGASVQNAGVRVILRPASTAPTTFTASVSMAGAGALTASTSLKGTVTVKNKTVVGLWRRSGGSAVAVTTHTVKTTP